MTVEQIIGNVFNIEPENLNDSSSRDTVEEWDSMGHLIIILELEKQFNVSIAIADVMEMVSVGKIKAVLQGYRAGC